MWVDPGVSADPGQDSPAFGARPLLLTCLTEDRRPARPAIGPRAVTDLGTDRLDSLTRCDIGVVITIPMSHWVTQHRTRNVTGRKQRGP